MRILIAEDEVLTRMDLRALLEDAGMEVVGEAKDGLDAVCLAEEFKPDLILMDIKMPHLDGLAAARMIIRKDWCRCIVMLTAFSDSEYINNALETGVYGYLVKPLNPKTLIPSLQIAYQKASEHNQMEGELNKVRQKLEDRVVIERAKGYLMRTNQMSEEEAYHLLRELSQKKRCSMRFVAEAMIIQDEDKD